jgi:hypothetical protein
MAGPATFLDKWARSNHGARLAASASSITACALIFTLAAFVWWNLQPGFVALVDLRPDNLEVKRLGPGWPVPAYTGHSQWGRADFPAEQLFTTPRGRGPDGALLAPPHSWFTQIVPNAFFGMLLVSALLANIARGCRDRDQDDAEETDDDDAEA